MRRSKVVAKLRGNRFVRMAAMGHVNPAFIRHAAHFGYDGIWLDLEHRTMTEREVQLLLAYAALSDIDVMIRPPTLEKTRLYRYLEDGASGLMIPHVSTPEKARILVEAVKFPPIGDRGFDGAGFDADYALCDPVGYPMEANRETFLVCQIETPEAVRSAEKIAAVEGVDVLFIGPADLSLRLAHDPTGLTLDEAVELVRDACGKHGKKWGITAGTFEELKRRKALGASLVPWGSEFMAILHELERSARELGDLGA